MTDTNYLALEQRLADTWAAAERWHKERNQAVDLAIQSQGERDRAFVLMAEMDKVINDLRAENQLIQERMRSEIHHAADNGHRLDRDCQGVGPGETVPAVRVEYIEALLQQMH